MTPEQYNSLGAEMRRAIIMSAPAEFLEPMIAALRVLHPTLSPTREELFALLERVRATSAAKKVGN